MKFKIALLTVLVVLRFTTDAQENQSVIARLIDQLQHLNVTDRSDPTITGSLVEILSVPNWGKKVYTLLTELTNIFSDQAYPLRIKDLPEQEYDYIVVGAGAAGSIVASRLSEDPSVSVLVLEVGGPETRFTATPFVAALHEKSEKDWGFQTVPQKFASFGYKRKALPITQGKSIGGSSAINGLIYMRGNPKDYNRWVEMGAEGWSYKEVFPYFIKSEGFTGDPGSSIFQEGYHNMAGPIKVVGESAGKVTRVLMKGIKELGLPVGDYNADDTMRFNFVQSTKNNGTRCSAACAFLGPASFRSNLDVVPGALVRKILFQENRAYGVEFEKRNEIHKVHARKEVILCGGVFNTPKLLLLSGIGPKQDLENLDIPVVYHSPGVGQNLQDHPRVFAFFTIRKDTTFIYTKVDQVLVAATQYAHNRTGPFAGGNPISGYIRTKFAPDSRPDIQLTLTGGLLGSAYSFIHQGYVMNIRDDIMEQFFGPHANKDGFQISVSGARPASRGYLTLKTSNPKDMPEIDPQYLSDRNDLGRLLEGLKIALKVAQSKAVREGLKAELFHQHLPGCEEYKLFSEEYWSCYVLTMASSDRHLCCTAKMGSKDDPMAVVDSKLRVKGVSNLRVIDSSVMPEVTTGNIFIPTTMIAEKGSDLIKGRAIEAISPPIKDYDRALEILQVLPP